MRTSIRRTMTLVGVAGAAFAIGIAPASASVGTANQDDAKVQEAQNSKATHELSPETEEAWETFIEGGNNLTGGAAMLVSGAWIGAPWSIVQMATTGELSPEVEEAWRVWNEGGAMVGRGAAQLVSGAWIGAPSSILDLISEGATPEDLTPEQLDQVSFLLPVK